MKKKILGMLLILAILFPYCEIQKNDVEAMSPPYLTENYEKDVIANDNAILDVELNNLERKQIYGFEIVLTSDGVETIRYQKKVSDNGEKVHVTFDIKNDSLPLPTMSNFFRRLSNSSSSPSTYLCS